MAMIDIYTVRCVIQPWGYSTVVVEDGEAMPCDTNLNCNFSSSSNFSLYLTLFYALQPSVNLDYLSANLFKRN